MKTSMRYLAVIFAVAMMLCALSVSANAFDDIKNDTAHVKAIESLTSLGIVHGYEDNTFRPDLPVRRDEMAKLVYTVFTTSIDAGEGTAIFPDVEANSWAKGYISWCSGKNIVGGYEDGTFKPEGNVTYDEALKMVCAMLGYTDFKAGLWPVDVRTKALIDLNLGEELKALAGDAVLTRAQVAQLFYNAMDEQMYVPAPEETKVGNLTVSATAQTPGTLAKDVWGYEEAKVRIVGTESYYIEAAYKVKEGATIGGNSPENSLGDNSKTVSDTNVDYITYPKGSKNEIVLAYLDEDDKFVAEKVGDGYQPKYITVSLEDVNLEAYEGKTDELLARDIIVFVDLNKNEFLTTTLKGKMVEGITGTYVTANVPEDEASYTGTVKDRLSHRYSTHGAKIDGITYLYEDFYKIRNLVYMPETDGKVLCVPTYGGAHLTSHFYVDDDLNLINRYWYHGYRTSNDSVTEIADPRNDYRYNFPTLLERAGDYSFVRKGIDSDSDGYYDYVTIAFNTPYRVTAVTKNSITLQSLNYEKYVVTYVGDKFHSEIDRPKLDDIIIGYFICDDFYHQSTTKTITGFATKYSTSDTASVTLYGLGTYKANTNLHTKRNYNPANDTVKALITDINKTGSFMGYDDTKGDYTYVTYYIYDSTIVSARLATAEEIKAASGGKNKAILQFVDKPTEYQLNEKTKKYEIFYPAYLLIDGKEELVNLSPTKAINGTEAATVAQDGTWYRAYIEDGVVMYPNLLVEFVVDTDGYYSLKTSAGEDKIGVDDSGKTVSKVIANKDGRKYYLAINPETSFLSIVDEDDNVIEKRLTVNDSSVLYYPYLTKDTGAHQFIGFCTADEIPAEFDKIELIGDTYITYDEATGFYAIETTMLALGGFDEVAVVPDAGNYLKDARTHLIATANTEAEYDSAAKEIYATYAFENLYTGADVVTTNKKLEYSEATKAAIGTIYAWDAEKEDYVAVTASDAYSVETLETTMTDLSLVFTYETSAGYKLNEEAKLYAVKNTPNEENEALVYEEIALEDIETLLATVEEYNEYHNDGADYKVTLTIGTYVDENRKEQVAYVILDWVEFNEELDAYTFAGVAK